MASKNMYVQVLMEKMGMMSELLVNLNREMETIRKVSIKNSRTGKYNI